MIRPFFRILGLIPLLWVAQACLAPRPASSPGGGSPYVSYFAGEDGTQYFIKPLDFQNSEGTKATVDFTFRSRDTLSPSAEATVNISIFQPDEKDELPQVPAKVWLQHDTTRIILRNPERLLISPQKKTVNNRFTSTCNARELKSLFEAGTFQLLVGEKEPYQRFAPTKKTEKKITRTQAGVFRWLN